MAKSKQGPKKNGIGWAQSVRDILIASMNRGQFPLAIFGMVLLLMVFRMSEADVGKLVFLVIEKLESWWILGYLLFVAALGGWFFHSKYQRRVITEEMARLGAERTELQEKLGNKVKSSAAG